MASIFTYEPDTPRVASPWLQNFVKDASQSDEGRDRPNETRAAATKVASSPFESAQGPVGITRLQAEPQEGPVEYKLHLLLRPRRKFRSTSTGSRVSGSRHSRLDNGQPARNPSESLVDPETRPGNTTPPSSSMQQTRQHRLEQLTTQLLWRLQQSSPHHSSSATNTILPSLPEALPELQAPQQPSKLLHGLEESQGALYEIGVSDDGALIGLAEDEMQESLNNLRAMAACLGCTVEVLRQATVGDCEWLEEAVVNRKMRRVRRTGKLIVVEALVKPHLQIRSPLLQGDDIGSGDVSLIDISQTTHLVPAATDQLRITLTGPTMSGKSTLLGTLTTSTLDNGKGKSRLSMLRHRHEISSGVTSSVTQELLGYQDSNDGSVDVINYAVENVASWIDIHVAAGGSRLVFVSDSAGHPRYRRTTLRGLVGWAPHWVLLCVSADDTEEPADTNSSRQKAGTAVSDVDLSGAQLELCLKLRLPIVVVITKLDLASKACLKGTLTKVLDALKAAGRKPAILKSASHNPSEEDLQAITASMIDGAYDTALPLLNDPTGTVPIALTSAVHGTGIRNLHALLHELPIPDRLPEPTANTSFVFHIEDVYNKLPEVEGVIVSGRLRCGEISVGDAGALGPFSVHEPDDSEDSEDGPPRHPASHLPASRSFPGALREAHLAPPRFLLPNQEWRRFRATSIRNLRLPVHTLQADQVGTIAIVPDDPKDRAASIAAFARIRKGMVLTTVQPQATRSFVARFRREDLESLAVGNHVVVYIASVRASARVISARAPDSPDADRNLGRHLADVGDTFEFDDVALSVDQITAEGHSERVAGMVTAASLLVTFSFDSSKEAVFVGDPVLVMPGGGPGLYGGQERGEKGVAGLEGFVGTVTQIHP